MRLVKVGREMCVCGLLQCRSLLLRASLTCQTVCYWWAAARQPQQSPTSLLSFFPPSFVFWHFYSLTQHRWSEAGFFFKILNMSQTKCGHKICRLQTVRFWVVVNNENNDGTHFHVRLAGVSKLGNYSSTVQSKYFKRRGV